MLKHSYLRSIAGLFDKFVEIVHKMFKIKNCFVHNTV